MDSVLAGRLVPLLSDFGIQELPVRVIYPARRIASTNLGAFVRNARAYFMVAPLLPIEAWVVRRATIVQLSRVARIVNPRLAALQDNNAHGLL